VVIYATCLVNWNKPSIGMAARAVLAHNGAEVEVLYPECCGMPQLETGNIVNVTDRAKNVSSVLSKYIDRGYDIVSLVSSCSLMLKQEWPNLLPNDEGVKKLAAHSFDISEYVVNASKKEGLLKDLKPISSSVALHHACHARAQNMGFKSREMLNLIPGIQLSVIERCSGHGGSFGVKKDTFPTALSVGKPVFNRVKKEHDADSSTIISSDCPLASDHIKQGVREISENHQGDLTSKHPIELLAASYGLQV